MSSIKLSISEAVGIEVDYEGHQLRDPKQKLSSNQSI